MSEKPASGTAAPRKASRKLDLDALLIKVLNLLMNHNPSKLTFSQVSRLTGVPRPTLYYYFGNSPKTMIDEAVRHGMKSFTRFYALEQQTEARDWETFQRDRLRDVVALIRKYPWGPALYFQYRNNAGEFGDTVRDIEEKYVQRIGMMWKRFNGTEPDVRALRMSSYLKLGFLWGITLDRELWLGTSDDRVIDPLIDEFTRTVTRTMAMKLPR